MSTLDDLRALEIGDHMVVRGRWTDDKTPARTGYERVPGGWIVSPYNSDAHVFVPDPVLAITAQFASEGIPATLDDSRELALAIVEDSHK